jgi:hypothetical protein
MAKVQEVRGHGDTGSVGNGVVAKACGTGVGGQHQGDVS